MRKRHAARPVLESMENRMVPSAVGAAHPAAEVHAARSSRDAARVDHAATQAAREAAAKARHAARAAHAAAHPKATTKSTSSPSVISSFFKSVFGGL